MWPNGNASTWNIRINWMPWTFRPKSQHMTLKKSKLEMVITRVTHPPSSQRSCLYILKGNRKSCVYVESYFGLFDAWQWILNRMSHLPCNLYMYLRIACMRLCTYISFSIKFRLEKWKQHIFLLKLSNYPQQEVSFQETVAPSLSVVEEAHTNEGNERYIHYAPINYN